MKRSFRHLIQGISTLAVNSYLVGYFQGKIFQGETKYACVPVLNCYSCPGAVGSCPVGALQNSLSSNRYNVPFYVVGLIMLFGILIGRLICGFLCPFGLVQDLLYKIKSPKLKLPNKIDKPLRMLKYLVLAVFVIILPLTLVNAFGIGAPYFCKWICPAGTLGAGIPLIILNPFLQSQIGALFYVKLSILLFFLVLSVFLFRPFCKYVCPLGAIYGGCNHVSFYRLELDKSLCIDCKKCEKHCNMQVNVTKNINSSECIRCLECVGVCPTKAIKGTFSFLPERKTSLPYIEIVKKD